MKFVFALALVALCVILLHARPNIKRDRLRIQKRNADHHNHGKGDGKRQHGSKVNPDQSAKETAADKAEEHGEEQSGIEKRAATKPTIIRWKSTTIYYKFDPPTYGSKMRGGKTLAELVLSATRAWNHHSGLNIVKFNSAAKAVQAQDIVYIRPCSGGCWSYVGYQPKVPNQICLENNDCFDVGVIMHEFGHLLGLLHEAQRADRDKYIHVNENNVKDGYKKQLELLPDAEPIKSGSWTGLGVEDYDVCSIMHYPSEAFTKVPGSKTIDLDKPWNPCMGAGKHLSLIDGKAMAVMYNTIGSEEAQEKAKCENDGYVLEDAEDVCVCSPLFYGQDCSSPVSDDTCKKVNVELGTNEVQKIETPGKDSGSNYPNNLECEWVVKAKAGNVLHVSGNYDIEAPATNGKCAFDYLMIVNDVNKDETNRVCGKGNAANEINSELQSRNQMIVKFVSDDAYPAKGFSLEIKAVQGGTKVSGGGGDSGGDNGGDSGGDSGGDGDGDDSASWSSSSSFSYYY